MLCLREAHEDDGWMLNIMDVSANGTWLNGNRLSNGQMFRVRPGDKISFLPPKSDECLDPLTYEVVDGTMMFKPGPKPTMKPTATSWHHHRGASCQLDLSGADRLSECGDCAARPATACFARASAQPNSAVDGGIDEARFVRRTRPRGGTVNISSWLVSLGNGNLMQYEDALLTNYDDVFQICSMYAGNRDHFFEDLGVENTEHREIFKLAFERFRTCAANKWIDVTSQHPCKVLNEHV